MLTGMTKHFMFHILWISILIFLYFNLFSASFYITLLFDGLLLLLLLLLLFYYYYYYYYYYYDYYLDVSA
jgi:hypothetical protein